MGLMLTAFFAGKNPSSENLAYYIYQAMKDHVQASGVKVLKVKVWESENAAVTYIGE